MGMPQEAEGGLDWVFLLLMSVPVSQIRREEEAFCSALMRLLETHQI